MQVNYKMICFYLEPTLDKILKDWNSKDLIKKKGRGLIG